MSAFLLRLLIPSICLSGFAASAGGLLMVDPGVREIRACRLTFVSFRTAQEGWVSDMCGHIYVTHNGGDGWTRDKALEHTFFQGEDLPPGLKEALRSAQEGDDEFDQPSAFQHLGFMQWLSPTDAVAGGYVGAKVFLTHDSGQTWTTAPLPADQWVYDVFARGRTVWLCGSSGEIDRSDDGGATWRRMESPFNDVDRCWTLSFDARHNGRATGMSGSEWLSKDDGLTWQLAPSSPAPPALVHTGKGSTTAHTLPDGGYMLVDFVEPAHRPESTMGRQSKRGEGTARIVTGGTGEEHLSLEDPGRPPRVVPLRTETTGKTETLLAVEESGGARYGFSTERFYFADDGATWYARSKLPGALPLRATLLRSGAVVLETGTTVFVSDDGGRIWEESKQAEFDRADAKRQRDARMAGAEPAQATPLDCVTASRDARLEVEFATQGCFGGTKSALVVDVVAGRSTLHGSLDLGMNEPSARKADLSAAELQRLVSDLNAAVTRAEKPAGCTSTTAFHARVSWRCGGAGAEGHSLSFTTYDCDPHMLDGVGGNTSHHTSAEEGYARALGVHRVAREFLARRSRE